ncbi:hypothetical protein HanIR_Chr12g0566671 [Helianthus annuus]|nr:hypothetical protein HanIR_Chr12g0566671 [Helianthus annuus]
MRIWIWIRILKWLLIWIHERGLGFDDVLEDDVLDFLGFDDDKR